VGGAPGGADRLASGRRVRRSCRRRHQRSGLGASLHRRLIAVCRGLVRGNDCAVYACRCGAGTATAAMVRRPRDADGGTRKPLRYGRCRRRAPPRYYKLARRPDPNPGEADALNDRQLCGGGKSVCTLSPAKPVDAFTNVTSHAIFQRLSR